MCVIHGMETHIVNITKRENGIYMAELRVPKDVRHIIGKTRLTRSLKTKDKRIAQQEPELYWLNGTGR